MNPYLFPHRFVSPEMEFQVILEDQPATPLHFAQMRCAVCQQQLSFLFHAESNDNISKFIIFKTLPVHCLLDTLPPNDLLATVLLSHGSPNPFVLLVAPVVKRNLPTDPHIPLQTVLYSGVFAINIIKLSLQPRELTTHSWSNPHQIVLDANGTQ